MSQEGEEYPKGTVLKVDDRALVQVVSLEGDGDSYDGELFLRNDTEDEEVETVEMDQEVQYETVNVSDYTTYVITSENEGKEGETTLEKYKDSFIAKI